MANDLKKKALENALKDIEKHFGKGAIDRLGNNKRMNVDVIPTDILRKILSSRKKRSHFLQKSRFSTEKALK